MLWHQTLYNHSTGLTRAFQKELAERARRDERRGGGRARVQAQPELEQAEEGVRGRHVDVEAQRLQHQALHLQQVAWLRAAQPARRAQARCIRTCDACTAQCSTRVNTAQLYSSRMQPAVGAGSGQGPARTAKQLSAMLVKSMTEGCTSCTRRPRQRRTPLPSGTPGCGRAACSRAHLLVLGRDEHARHADELQVAPGHGLRGAASTQARPRITPIGRQCVNKKSTRLQQMPVQ